MSPPPDSSSPAPTAPSRSSGSPPSSAWCRWACRIRAAGDATPARLNPVIEGLAVFYATWLRIHPFADGNGRTARVLANWIATRYWQPPILPGRPVADADALVMATSPAIPEAKPNYRPLELHLRRRLKDARAAAAGRL